MKKLVNTSGLNIDGKYYIFGDIKEGVNLEVIQTKHFSTGEDAYLLEQKLLNRYKEFQYLGTNVLRGGNSELLVLSDDQVKQITLELNN
jgi:hypothetical protein